MLASANDDSAPTEIAVPIARLETPVVVTAELLDSAAVAIGSQPNLNLCTSEPLDSAAVAVDSQPNVASDVPGDVTRTPAHEQIILAHAYLESSRSHMTSAMADLIKGWWAMPITTCAHLDQSESADETTTCKRSHARIHIDMGAALFLCVVALFGWSRVRKHRRHTRARHVHATQAQMNAKIDAISKTVHAIEQLVMYQDPRNHLVHIAPVQSS